MQKITYIPLPYWNERPKKTRIKSIVLHCSTHEAVPMIKLLKNLHLSAHFVIGTDGRIFQLVPEEKRAFHAGTSRWRNMENLNHHSIGIELSAPKMGQTMYPEAQIKAAIGLCRDLMRSYDIPAVNVVAHSDVAPTRKPDPGLMFPWKKFADKGVGLWYEIADANKINENDKTVLLQKIGYDTRNLAAASYAFCRHFLPQFVATEDDICKLITHIYPPDFSIPDEGLPVLKACAYAFTKFD